MQADNGAVDEAIYTAVRKVKPSLINHPMDPATDLRSLGLDSLEIMTVEFEIEEAFGISIVDSHLDAFRTVEQARGIIQRILHEKAPQESGQQEKQA